MVMPAAALAQKEMPDAATGVSRLRAAQTNLVAVVFSPLKS
jgi:hypothetical protein